MGNQIIFRGAREPVLPISARKYYTQSMQYNVYFLTTVKSYNILPLLFLFSPLQIETKKKHYLEFM